MQVIYCRSRHHCHHLRGSATGESHSKDRLVAPPPTVCEEDSLPVANLQLRAEGIAPVWQDGSRVNKTGGGTGGTFPVSFVWSRWKWFRCCWVESRKTTAIKNLEKPWHLKMAFLGPEKSENSAH